MKKIPLIVIIIFFLISCAPTDNSPSILDGQVCGASCWNHITVGKTTRQDLKELISKIPNVDQSSVANLEEPESDVVFQVYRDWQDRKAPVNVGIKTSGDEDKVFMIIFNGDLGLTSQKIADAFGEPDFASSVWSADGGVCVSLINSQVGTQFYNCANSEKSSITPDAKVLHLVLFDPATFQSLVDGNFFKSGPRFVLYPWTGYGKIEDHYWPPDK
jgi:hypothetical protein